MDGAQEVPQNEVGSGLFLPNVSAQITVKRPTIWESSCGDVSGGAVGAHNISNPNTQLVSSPIMRMGLKRNFENGGGQGVNQRPGKMKKTENGSGVHGRKK